MRKLFNAENTTEPAPSIQAKELDGDEESTNESGNEVQSNVPKITENNQQLEPPPSIDNLVGNPSNDVTNNLLETNNNQSLQQPTEQVNQVSNTSPVIENNNEQTLQQPNQQVNQEEINPEKRDFSQGLKSETHTQIGEGNQKVMEDQKTSGKIIYENTEKFLPAPFKATSTAISSAGKITKEIGKLDGLDKNKAKELGTTSTSLGIAKDALGGITGLIGFATAARKVYAEKEYIKKFEGVVDLLSSGTDIVSSGVGVSKSITSLAGVSKEVTDGILGRIGDSLGGLSELLSGFKTGFLTLYKTIQVFKDIYNKKSPAKDIEDSIKNLMKTLSSTVKVASSVLTAINNPALSTALSALGIVGSSLSILAEGINMIFSLIKIIKAYFARKSIEENKDESLTHLQNFLIRNAVVKRKGKLEQGLTIKEYKSGVLVEDKRGVFGFREVFIRVSPGILAAIDQGKTEVKVTNDCTLIINDELRSAVSEYELVSKIDEVGSKRNAKGILEMGNSILTIGTDIINIVTEAIALAGAAPSAGASLALKVVGPTLKAGIGIGSFLHKGAQFAQGIYRDITGAGKRQALNTALESGKTLEEINKIGTDKSAVTKNAEYVRQARSLVEMGARAAQAKDEGKDQLALSLFNRLKIYIDAIGADPAELEESLNSGDYKGYIKTVSKAFKER
jgi:hypothetical protein